MIASVTNPESRTATAADTAAVRAGDPAAFDRLYDQFAPRVMGFGLRLTGGDRAAAEDLTQDTFLAAFAGRSGYGGRAAKPLPWLLGIAWRRWRDGLRRQSAAPPTVPLNEEMVPAIDPIGHLATAVTLEASMAKLPTNVRESLLLTAVQGLTYAEAAKVLGEPVGTVKWRVHEGTRALRRILTVAEEHYEATANRTDRTTPPAAASDAGRNPARVADAARRR